MEPSTAAACASCRRHPLPPSLLLCLLLVALCLPPGERSPAEKGDRAVPVARNLAEGRLGPQVAVSARGSLLPAGFPSLTRPSFTGAPRHLLRGPCAWPCVTPGCWCSPHPIFAWAGAGPHLPPPPALGKAAEDGRRGELKPPLPRERQELFQRCGELRGGGLASPRGKWPWGPSGALSPAAGQRAGRGDGARLGVRFTSRLGGTSPQRAASNFGSTASSRFLFFSAARGGARLPAAFALRGTSAVREPVGARACRRRGAVQQPAGCGEEARWSSPAVGVPCAGNRRSSAGEARSVSPAWDEAAPADRVRVGNFSPALVPYKHFRGVSQVRRRKEC